MGKFCPWCNGEFDAPGEHWYVSKTGYFTCKLRQKHHYDKDRETVKKRSAARYETMKQDPAWQEYASAKSKEYYYNNRAYCKSRNRAYYRNKLKTDPTFKLMVRIRTRLSDLVRRGKGRRASRELVGCSWEELRAHLESQFYPHPDTGEKMTWDNYGQYGWHIDHKKPFAAIDVTNHDQLGSVMHYSNLQPLWWFENLAKHAKYEEDHETN